MRAASILTLLFCIIITDLSAQSVIVAYDKDFEPYSYQNEAGNPDGAIIDIYKLWASKTNLEMSFVPCVSEDCMDLVLNNQADILAATDLTSDDKSLAFVPPMLRLSTSLFIRDDKVPASFSEFNDSLAFIKGTMLPNMDNEEFSDIKLKLVDTYLELKELVEEKELAAFIFEAPDPTDSELRLKAPVGYTRYQHLFTKEFRPIIKSDKKELISSLLEEGYNITSDELVEISTRHKLYMKMQPDYRRIYIAIVIGLISLVVILVIRNNKLRAVKSLSIQESRGLEEIIQAGESDKVEFKSSFHWDYRQEKPNKALQNVIMKTIAAFLNADGGSLVIGVDDEGKVLGLKNDYNSLKKSNRDGFMLVLTNLINQSFGKHTHRLIRISIDEVANEDVCAITISPSEEPVFLGAKGDEEFFVRASASSQPLSMSEALAYIKEHWSKA